MKLTILGSQSPYNTTGQNCPGFFIQDNQSSLLKEHDFPEINSHLTSEQAGIIAKEAGVKGLILNHFWPEEPVQKYVDEAKKVFQNVIPAIEGLTINIPSIEKELDERS